MNRILNRIDMAIALPVVMFATLVVVTALAVTVWLLPFLVIRDRLTFPVSPSSQLIAKVLPTAQTQATWQSIPSAKTWDGGLEIRPGLFVYRYPGSQGELVVSDGGNTLATLYHDSGDYTGKFYFSGSGTRIARMVNEGQIAVLGVKDKFILWFRRVPGTDDEWQVAVPPQ